MKAFNKKQRARKNKTEHFRLIFDSAPIAIMERDFSALLRLKEKFRRNHITQHRTYLRTHPRLIMDLLKDLRIVHLNPAALQLFAATSKKELSVNLHKTYVKESNRAIFEVFALLIEGKQRLESEIRMSTLDKKNIEVLMRINVPKMYANNLKRVIVSLEDISLQKKYERHLKRLAQTDGLTSVWNNGAIRERLEEEFLRAKRYKIDLSVLMIDLDRFKQINDSFGHQKGDLILRQTANLIKENLREVDVVGRYGGDEFMAILPETPVKNAWYAAERIRNLFEQLSTNTKANIFSSLSIGITGFPSPNVTTARDLISRVDQAMYAAKKAGRNSIVTL